MHRRPMYGFAFTVLACLTLSSCDGGTVVRGYVRDSSGVPIFDASITMAPVGESRKWEVRSAKDGSYGISMLHAPGNSVVLTVSKQGYAAVERRLHARGEPLNEDFTLTADKNK